MILGDSMIKALNGWEMSQDLNNCKVAVRKSSSATVKCMEDYVNPSLREDPDHFILHIRTNDLNSSKSAESIAESIVLHAKSLKNEKHDVSVSNVITRKDRWREKAVCVNTHLKDMCTKENLFYITDTLKQKHTNKGRLHLNSKGSSILGKTFVNHISSIFH